MDLTTFQTNFTVSVVNILSNAVNDTIQIGFKVTCSVNNRVGIFIENVVLSNLSQGYTMQDVIDTAWDAQKQNIHDWAFVNLPHDVLSEYIPETTTTDISLTDFNNNFNVRVSRYELYPSEQPQFWCVGLVVSHKVKGVSTYRDCSLPTNQHCNNVLCTSVVTAAWDIMQSSICAWAKEILSQDDLINTSYSTSNWV